MMTSWPACLPQMAEKFVITNWLGQDELNIFNDEVFFVHKHSDDDGRVSNADAYGDDDNMASLRSIQDHTSL